jgi:purine-binding chemotaxis protein CheW
VKYLSFELGTETFGVPVELVQEVLEHTRVTRVPRCPDYLLGIINLRGSIVAVMDLRRRLGIEEREITVTTRFVVLNLTIEEQPTQVAVMADTVDEVVDIAADDIDPAPTAGGDGAANAANLVGVAKLRDRMVLLLDAECLLTGEVLAETFGMLDSGGTS